MIWSVPNSWPGETCFLLAGGPSLCGFDANVLRAKGRVIAINDSWRMAPWADVCYFCDSAWWSDQMGRNPRSLDGETSFHQMIYRAFWVSGSVGFHEHPQVRQLRLTGYAGLDADPSALKHGSNSGYQAIHLAYHFGAQRIVLLGYDMRVQGSRTHWHDAARPDGFSNVLAQSMLPAFPSLVEPLDRAGVEVLNATPDSALTCWPYCPLADILAETGPRAAA